MSFHLRRPCARRSSAGGASSPRVLSPLTSRLSPLPFFHHVIPTPESGQFVPWCGIRLQTCGTGSTDAKVGSEQKRGPALSGQTGSGKVAAKPKEPMHPRILFRGAANFPFPFSSSLFPFSFSLSPFPSSHPPRLVDFAASTELSTLIATGRIRTWIQACHQRGGWASLGPGAGKATVAKAWQVVAAQVVIAQPPGFHVSCFPKPLLMQQSTGHETNPIDVHPTWISAPGPRYHVFRHWICHSASRLTALR